MKTFAKFVKKYFSKRDISAFPTTLKESQSNISNCKKMQKYVIYVPTNAVHMFPLECVLFAISLILRAHFSSFKYFSTFVDLFQLPFTFLQRGNDSKQNTYLNYFVQGKEIRSNYNRVKNMLGIY